MSDSKANYHICGLDFELVGDAITTRQDDYLMAHLRRAGVMDVIATMKDADAEEKSSELLTRILTSGQKSEILAGLLTEPGKKWNRKRADALAEIFGDATENADKELMRSAIVAFVLGFFLSGPRSSTSSPKSSEAIIAEPTTESAELTTSATSL